ncbi:ribonuclease P protein subunit p40-like isoform X2 [Ylistrum balloti]|uniref:ribonuclease P protein subunit p40-like isoform X2 n=1 Tax=Ylistrum balloti TaxID=509963 RepID=UPI002905ECE0|nr:ribonuclease P protein subunit p40-like isoform X2 [Ylistrum balloti]
MAAPMFSKRESLGKRIFEASSFLNSKSKHKGTVLNHYFNCSVGLTLPDTNTVPDAVHDICMEEKSFTVQGLSVLELIDMDLIGAFIKTGRLCLMSHKTHIDNEDCVAVLPNGHLILHLTKDTYQCLGLEGRPAEFPRRNPDKFVVTINLLEKCFRPEKKKYQQVFRSLRDRLDVRFDVIMTWTPNDAALCSSSLQKYFQIKGHNCLKTPVKCQQRLLKHLEIPLLDAELDSCDEREYTEDDMYEWLGGVAVNSCLNGDPDSYITTYRYPGPMREADHSVYVQYKGFFSPSTIHEVLEELRFQQIRLLATLKSLRRMKQQYDAENTYRRRKFPGRV